MFYNIAGIVIGALLLLSSCMVFKSHQEKIRVLLVGLIFSIGLIVSGIAGFFIPDQLSYITILLLLVFSIGYLIFYYLVLKEKKEPQQTKINTRK